MKDVFVTIIKGLLSSEECIISYKKIIQEDTEYKDFDIIINKILAHWDNSQKIITPHNLTMNIPKNIQYLVIEANNIEFNAEDFEDSLNVLNESIQKNTIIQLAEWLKMNVANKSITDISQVIDTVNDNLQKSFAVNQSINDITDMIKKFYSSGIAENYLLTGDDYFDMYVGLRMNIFVLVAADKAMGKTRYISDKMLKIIHNNANVVIYWETLEMTPDELVKSFVANMTGIPEMIVRQKKRKLTEYEMEQVFIALDKIKKMPIEFDGKPKDINTVCRNFRNFAKKNKDKSCILVLDNIGCLDQTSDNETSHDNDVARKLIRLRDHTKGLIIALHHLGKEVNNKFNKDNGYEPTINNIRGSNRLSDFSNITLLLYRPSTYKDLCKEIKNSGDNDFYSKFLAYYKVIIAKNRNSAMDDKFEIHHFHDMDIMKFIELPI